MKARGMRANEGGIKKLRLPITIAVEQAGDEQYAVLTVTDAAVEQFTLVLSLLREGLIDTAHLSSTSGGRLRLGHDTSLSHARALARWDDDTLHLQLGTVELDCWLVFLLRYFRDGYGAVSHLDLEAARPDPDGGPMDIVLEVEWVGPARLSTQELRSGRSEERRR